MKKAMTRMMQVASVALLISCSAGDPFSDYTNSWGDNWGNDTPSENSSGSSTTTGDLTTFTVNIDQTSAEPTDAATEYMPDEEDALENSTFTTEVAIDMANPTAKTENGVEITVNGGHITANHGSTKNICYVVSGTMADGSLTISGSADYEIKLNNVSIGRF